MTSDDEWVITKDSPTAGAVSGDSPRMQSPTDSEPGHGPVRRGDSETTEALVLGVIPIPPFVYVPVTDESAEEGSRLLLADDEKGRRALPVFTSHDRFVAGLGIDARWALQSAAQVQEIVRAGHATYVAVDIGIDAHYATTSTDEGGPR
ncbi:SAV_915 family protein [Georgenia sp. Z1344]|uniref:SAV_915 family protein n=1 Tax=Georgenia sp. Z1344 TaxID=3416706 RepID=UPI003CF3250A